MTTWSELERRRALLEADLNRWLGELENAARETLSQGILSRAAAEFERVIRDRLEIAAQENPSKAQSVVELVGQGKPIGKLTLGQCINALLMLDKAKELGTHHATGTPLNATQLRSIVKSRNEVLHGRVASTAKIDVVRRFLTTLRDVCQDSLLREPGN